MGEESRGVLQQKELPHIWTKTGGKESKYPDIIICISLEKPADFISQVLSISAACFLLAFFPLGYLNQLYSNKANKYLLEIVRLQEFAVIQQVSQMSHKPPVAQDNAVFEAKEKTEPATARDCARFSTGISYQYTALLQCKVWLQCPRPNGILLVAASFTYFCWILCKDDQGSVSILPPPPTPNTQKQYCRTRESKTLKLNLHSLITWCISNSKAAIKIMSRGSGLLSPPRNRSILDCGMRWQDMINGEARH